MKIAFIGQKGIPTLSGGVEKHVEKLAVRLAELGHEVTVYTRPHYTPKSLKRFHGVRLLSLPSIRTKHLDAISHTLLATLDALFRDYDVIHYQSIGPSVLSFLPRLFKPHAQVVATFHSRDYFHKKWGFFARLALRAAEFITCHIPERTIVISKTLAAHAKKAYHKDAVYIPNGAEVDTHVDPSLLGQFDLKPKHYILSVSRLIEHKGIHHLIKAYQDLEDTGKLPNNFKLVIVGTHANTADYERYLKLLAYGRSNILFLGERRGKELATLFHEAALFVQPSEDEGLSIALLEAMAYGILPIVSDIPANVEPIAGGYGVHFPVKNVEALKQRLAYYVIHLDEASEIGAMAKRRIEEEYSWDAIAKKTSDLYHELGKERALKSRFSFDSKHVA